MASYPGPHTKIVENLVIASMEAYNDPALHRYQFGANGVDIRCPTDEHFRVETDGAGRIIFTTNGAGDIYIDSMNDLYLQVRGATGNIEIFNTLSPSTGYIRQRAGGDLLFSYLVNAAMVGVGECKLTHGLLGGNVWRASPAASFEIMRAEYVYPYDGAELYGYLADGNPHIIMLRPSVTYTLPVFGGGIVLNANKVIQGNLDAIAGALPVLELSGSDWFILQNNINIRISGVNISDNWGVPPASLFVPAIGSHVSHLEFDRCYFHFQTPPTVAVFDFGGNVAVGTFIVKNCYTKALPNGPGTLFADVTPGNAGTGHIVFSHNQFVGANCETVLSISGTFEHVDIRNNQFDVDGVSSNKIVELSDCYCAVANVCYNHFTKADGTVPGPLLRIVNSSPPQNISYRVEHNWIESLHTVSATWGTNAFLVALGAENISFVDNVLTSEEILDMGSGFLYCDSNCDNLIVKDNKFKMRTNTRNCILVDCAGVANTPKAIDISHNEFEGADDATVVPIPGAYIILGDSTFTLPAPWMTNGTISHNRFSTPAGSAVEAIAGFFPAGPTLAVFDGFTLMGNTMTRVAAGGCTVMELGFTNSTFIGNASVGGFGSVTAAAPPGVGNIGIVAGLNS